MRKIAKINGTKPNFDAEIAIVNGVQVWLIGGEAAAHAAVREAVTFALEVLTTDPDLQGDRET